MQPTRDRVLVKADPPPEKVGSIFLPDSAITNKTPMMDGLKAVPGIVVAVGPGFYDDDGDFVPTTVKPGDKVWVTSRWNDMPQYSETERLIQEADILGWRT